MLSDESPHIDIDNLFYRCGKIRKRVLITYLATAAGTPDGAPGGLPDMTAFDCSHRRICGVCASTGRWLSCRWDLCVHPGLSSQEPSAEAESASSSDEEGT
jgi:hypothetical protein